MEFPLRIITEDIVLDKWHTTIEDGFGKAGEIYASTEAFIKQYSAPGITIAQETFAPGIIQGILGSKRSFMVVKNTRNRDLKSFVIYVHAEDYGTALTVSWWLCTRVGFWQTVIAKAPYLFSEKEAPKTVVADLDLFQQQLDLRAFTTIVHRALLQAVGEVIRGLGQNPPHMSRNRGFLGIR